MRRDFIEPGVVRGEWWHALPDGRVQCDLCPRECKLGEGQRGFCFVRQMREGGMVLTSYGRASGFVVDPVEKKPLNHFLPGTSVLSFGTAGCNLGCRFCQNWEISKARAADRLADCAAPERVADAALAAGCRSVAFTYNDPVVFAEYAMDCAQAARDRGLKTVAVTAGYHLAPARGDFYRHIDAANVDLKGFRDAFYRRLCLGSLEPVLDTLQWLHRETAVWLEITTLLIPGCNDTEAEVDRLCAWIHEHLGPGVPLHFTAFHPDYKLLHVAPTPGTTLRRARQQARRMGLQHVYAGNVQDVESQSTYCPACGGLLIERAGYSLGRWNLNAGGACRECGAALAGRFEAQPGTWGNRRQRIDVR